MSNQLHASLKEINEEASKVSKEVQSSQDSTFITVLITKLANEAYMKGLEHGKAEALKNEK